MTSECLGVSLQKLGRACFGQCAKVLLNQQISEAAIQKQSLQNLFIWIITLKPMFDVLKIADHPHLVTNRLKSLAKLKFLFQHVLHRICLKLSEPVMVGLNFAN